MSEADPEGYAASEGDTGKAPDIAPGQRLMRVDGDKGLSLLERLFERLCRLPWRTTLLMMRPEGRYPFELIAVPDDPLAGDVRAGQALLIGQLHHRGTTRDIAMLDFAKPDAPAAFVDYLHSFAWLRDLSTVAPRAQASPIAEDLMTRWLAVHGETVTPLAWRVDHWGRRLLYWTAHAPLILSSTDLDYRSRIFHAIARGTRYLERGADKAPPGPQRVAAWCGVVASGLLVPGGEARLAFGEAGLARAIGTAVHDDGGAVSRSPAALLETISLLAMLRETYAARQLHLPQVAQAALVRMVAALLGTCHGDRALSSWQGGGPVSAERVADVIAATGIRTRPLRQARDWGYQRLAAGTAVLIVDAAPPPVGRVVDGGCASTLAFEFSAGEHRIVVNCGGAHATVAPVPAVMVEGLRTTAAHSTLTIGDSNSTAILPGGTLGRGVGEVELSRQESDAGSRIEASHDGYVRRWGFLHRRQLLLTSDGRELRGEDSLLPKGRKRRSDATGFAIRFHLGRGVEVSPTADGQAALLRLPCSARECAEGGEVWQFRCRGGAVSVEDSVWIDGDGLPIGTQQLVVTGEAAAGGTSVSWTLKRAR